MLSPVSVIGLDIQDDLGRHEVGFVDNTVKEPIEDEKGCRFKAEFKINKVKQTVCLPHLLMQGFLV